MRPFRPLLRNPHLSTLAGNFWVRPETSSKYPEKAAFYQTEPDVQVLVHEQRPQGEAKGELIVVHGLEGSSAAGYARSLAFAALEKGYAVHRFNMRSCGGTEHLAPSNYHAGQTSDLYSVARQIREANGLPIYLVGFSLGGNVVLKLAGELGSSGSDLVAGVCAVSTPIDLAACVVAIERGENFLYEWRFLTRLKERIRVRHQQDPARFPVEPLRGVKTIYHFDDLYTARFFGFGTADNYYATQSSQRFLDSVRVPALVVQAKDDPLIPFEVYDHPAFRTNSHLLLLATDHGGHLGFLADRQPRFWLDLTIVDWIESIQ